MLKEGRIEQVLDKWISIEDVGLALDIKSQSAYGFLYEHPELMVPNKNDVGTTPRKLFRHILRIGTSRYSKERIENAAGYLLKLNVKLDELPKLVGYAGEVKLKHIHKFGHRYTVHDATKDFGLSIEEVENRIQEYGERAYTRSGNLIKGFVNYLSENSTQDIVERKREKWYPIVELKNLFPILDQKDVNIISDIAREKDCLLDDYVKGEIVTEYIKRVGIEKLVSHSELKNTLPYLMDNMKEVLEGLVNGHGVCRPEIDLINRLYDVIHDVNEKFGENGRQKFIHGIKLIKGFSDVNEYKARCATILNFFLRRYEPAVDFSQLIEKERKSLFEKLKKYEKADGLPTSQEEFNIMYDRLQRCELLYDLSNLTKKSDYDRFVMRHLSKSFHKES